MIKDKDLAGTGFRGMIASSLGLHSAGPRIFPALAYGATGDGTTDDYSFLQNAINAAAAVGGEVLLHPGIFICSVGLTLPAGVSIRGISWGTNPLVAPTSIASCIKYTGSGTCLSINGSNVWMKRLVIYATNSTPTKGILINGDTNSIESCIIDDVLIYGFVGGNALELQGVNSGYVAYCQFNNLRIRNAKNGIYIHDTGGGGGFVNTNQFNGGAISGGNSLFDYAIHCSGGNDNRFVGMSVEPYTSTYGHIFVENNSLSSGSIYFNGRIEGANQPETTPLVHFSANTKDSFVSTQIGITGWVDDLGHNTVQDAGTKSPKLPTFTPNLFLNDSFEGYTAGSAGVTTGTIPSWTTLESGGVGVGSTFAVTAAAIVEDMPVLGITVPAGVTFNLRQTPASNSFSSGKSILFGSYVKTSAAISVQWASFNTDGVSPATVAGVAYNTTGAYSNTWQFLGGRQNMLPNSTVIRPFLVIANTTVAPITVFISAPVCSRGYNFPTPIASTGTGPLVRQTSPTFLGTIIAAAITLSAKLIAATIETTGKMGIGQAVGASQLEVTASSGAHVRLKGSQIAGLIFDTSSANASARRWDIRANSSAFGDLLLRVSADNVSDPATTVLAFDKAGPATFQFDLAALGSLLRNSATGIVASTTQTQGQGALTKEINIVSTVANVNDTVTLPGAAAGMTIYIRNNGAQTLKIFPASGDNINAAGLNVAVTLASGGSVTYRTADTTNWYS